MGVLRVLRPYLVVALLNASEGMAAMLVPPYLDSLGFAPAAVGIIVSAFAVASFLSRLPAGALYRGERARALLSSALAAVAVVSLAYPLATDAWSLLLLRGMHGLAYGLATTINLALFIDLLPPHASRHHAMGYFMAALGGGFTTGQAIAGFTADWWGYGWAYVIAALPPLIALTCVDAPPPSARPRPAAAAADHGLRATLRALTVPSLVPIVLLAFFMSFLLQVTSTFLPLYALGIGLGLAEIGLVRSAHSVCNSITRPFSGGFIQRIGHTRIGIGTLVLNTVLLVLVPATSTMLMLSSLMILIGLVRGVGMVANTISLAADVDETRVNRGVASGLYYASRDLGAILGPIVGGAAATVVGIDGMFRLVPPLALAAYLAGVVASARHAAHERARGAPLGQPAPRGH